MQKNLNISVLLDFYGPVLTEKQREVIELYYNEDLSLSEIAEHEGITRQGVRDSIKRGEAILLDMEERLQFASRYHGLQDGLDLIIQQAYQLRDYNNKFCFAREIEQNVENIIKAAETLAAQQ